MPSSVGTSSLLCFLLISASFAFDSDESSDSIEIPDRPEDRQAFRMLNQHQEDKESRTFLNLISKVVGTFQGSVENRTKRIRKKSHVKHLVHKTKKALSGINKAYLHMEKAKRKLEKNALYPL